MVTGNTFSFEEAQELGILNDIYERDGFMENMMEYAKQFCPPNKAAKAVGGSSGRCRRAGKFQWSRRWRSSARTNRSCSKAKTRRKVWPHTWKNGQQFSKRNRKKDPALST